MSIKYVTDEAELVIPGAYGSFKVEKNNSGVSTTGVLMLVGEADAGPDFSLESDLQSNRFTPDQLASVVRKYRSGNLVDAFRAATAPANDPDIVGAPTAIVLVKTNASTQASGVMSRPGLSDYATVQDQSFGRLGNLIYMEVASAVDESVPTSTFLMALGASASILGVRVDGSGKTDATAAANASPSAFVTALNAVPNLLAYGGVDRTTASISSVNVALSVSGNNVTITVSSGSWNVTPLVGDALIIPATGDLGSGTDSALIGAASANRGTYVVTSATSNTIVAKKIRDAGSVVVTPPVNVSSVAVAGDSEFFCYSPITIRSVSGVDRSLIDAGLVSGTVNVALTAAGQTLTFDFVTGSKAWHTTPRAGDLLKIPSGSAYQGGGNANVGWYVITAATSVHIVATRLSNGAPASVASTDIAATTDIQVFRPVIDGFAKSLELFDDAGAVAIGGRLFDVSGNAVTFLSTSSTPTLFVSANEYQATLKVTRQFDNVLETITAGGTIAMRVGYAGTTATLTINNTQLTTSVVSGLGGNLVITLSDFKTISDLVAFINSQTGYTASLSTTLTGQLPVASLDQGTFGICGQFNGTQPGRIKADAYKFFKAVTGGSATVNLAVEAATGLPEVQPVQYLAGGVKGGSTAAGVQAAIDALQKVRGNFLVPLFARDATDDITDVLTETTSTYTIDAINASAKSHVISMSQVKRRKPRLAFVSKRTTFAKAKEAANNLASERCNLFFQDFKNLDSSGNIKQFQPWMGAVLAAGMQGAGFYRAIFNKGINCSGIVQAAGDFSDMDDGAVEDALLNGLMVARRPEEGGFKWVSDQTTYGKDENFVFNSIQAMYVADLITQTTALRMERAFIGQSVADVSAAVALAFFESIMADFRRLKLIAPSDDAPKGFQNVTISLSGPVMLVSAEVKLAGAIYFIPISFLVTQTVQTASV